MTNEIDKALEQVRNESLAMERHRKKRDRAIRDARALGIPYGHIARAAGLSDEGIRYMIHGKRGSK